MKKTFLKILTLVLAAVLSMCIFVGCGDDFTTGKKNWGKTDGYANGGFVRETENYVYVINGQGDNTADNEFGKPVKGSLVAIEKSKIGTDKQNAEVVVPKLIVGTDYNAGIYIFGNYVYYGTPSTDKNPDGSIANTTLTFMRTKLDGTDTKEYFSIPSLSTEFRIVKAGSSVVIVYYDAETTSLCAYNTSSEVKTVIAKTDVKAKEESLATYKFVDNSASSDAVVVYTTTVYAEDYNSIKADALGSSYSRKTEDYNKVYAYKVGDSKAKCVLSGEKADEDSLDVKYTLSFVKDGRVFFSKIDAENIGVTKTYMVSVADLYNGNVTDENIVVNSADVKDTVVIKSGDKVYKLDGKFIVETTFVGSPLLTERTVAVVNDASKLIGVCGDYLYYTTSGDILMRVNILGEEKLAEQRVSDDVIQANWYKPTFMTIDGKTYLFFCDTSATGGSYVKAIDVDSEVIEDKNDNGDVTDTYLNASFHVAVMLDKDVASIASAKIKRIDKALSSNGGVVLEEVDGQLVMPAVLEARAVYNSLTSKQKELVSADTLNYLKKYEKAVEVSVKLHGLKDFDLKTDAEKDALRSVYEQAKKVIDALEKDGDFSVSNVLATNYRFFYQEADNYFNPTED